VKVAYLFLVPGFFTGIMVGIEGGVILPAGFLDPRFFFLLFFAILYATFQISKSVITIKNYNSVVQP
jgi:hypothetical protein